VIVFSINTIKDYFFRPNASFFNLYEISVGFSYVLKTKKANIEVLAF